MGIFRKNICFGSQRVSKAKANAVIENQSFENANKEKYLDQLKTELDYQKSQCQGYQKLAADMRDLLSYMMTQMSDMSRKLHANIVHNVLDKSLMMKEKERERKENTTGKGFMHINKPSKIQESEELLQDKIYLKENLLKANARLCEAEKRLKKNTDWIANAKSVLRERDLLLNDTRLLLKLKEKELAACKTGVMKGRCDEKDSDLKDSNASDIQVPMVDDVEANDSGLKEPPVQSEPLLSMDSGVRPDDMAKKVDFFARFMEDVQQKKKSGKTLDEELHSLQHVDYSVHAHYPHGNRAKSDFHYKMSDLAAATFF